MKKLIPFMLLLLLTSNWSVAQNTLENKQIIVKNEADLDKYLGQLITILGKVTNTKIPTIIGVDVADVTPDLRGHVCSATGILEKSTVIQENIDPHSANRGAGIFYRLKDPKTGHDATPVQTVFNE